MLGASRAKPKRLLGIVTSAPESETKWVTLDVLERAKPDHLFDLNLISQGIRLPFEDGEFDEIHAYEVLEHVGRQGDWKGYFREFAEYWRILKPGGNLIGTCPNRESIWAWGDPGHSRLISLECLSFLQRSFYEGNKATATDYREIINGRWWILQTAEKVDQRLRFCLEKSK